MARWHSDVLRCLVSAGLLGACADGPVRSRQHPDPVDPNDDNETVVESIDPRCGAVAVGNGCVIHRIRASAAVLEALGKPIEGLLYFGIYTEDKVGLAGPGDHTPDYANDPTQVGLHSPAEIVEVARGDMAPGEYETLALVDIDGLVDPNNRIGPSGAPSTVPGPTFTIIAGHTTTSDLVLELLLP